MYALISDCNGSEPFVVSTNSLEYAGYILNNYCQLFEGSKAECTKYLDELLAEIN